MRSLVAALEEIPTPGLPGHPAQWPDEFLEQRKRDEKLQRPRHGSGDFRLDGAR